MSRTSLNRPRPPQSVCYRTATDTRLFPKPFPPTILQPNPHYKRCPKALRLRLRSDQSPSRPLYGRSPDKTRHALSKSHCQVRAPLTRRKGFATSGDAPEHSVMSPPWAIAPLPDSPIAAFGEADPTSDGRESTLPFLRMVEHFWWSRPHRETISRLLHILSEVRGCRRAVTDVKPPLRRTPPIGTMAGHFWWLRLPHSEISSRLLHVLSEARGCRRVVADVNRPQGRTPRIATGVADILCNRPGPSITSPTHNPTHPSPPIGGQPCPEEAAGPAPAHPKETTTLSSTAETPVASGNSPKSLPLFPPPAALYKATPTKPGSHQPSHSPPLWTAFPSTPFASPTPPCRNSTIPLRPFSPPDPNGPGKSPLVARTRPKPPRELKIFRKIIKIHA